MNGLWYISSTTQRSSELHNRSTLSSGPHSTKSYPRFLAASSQSKTAATTPSGGSLLAGLNSKSARNKKKRNKQSYNPLKEMLEKQKLDKNRPSGKGIMDLLMNIDKWHQQLGQGVRNDLFEVNKNLSYFWHVHYKYTGVWNINISSSSMYKLFININNNVKALL